MTIAPGTLCLVIKDSKGIHLGKIVVVTQRVAVPGQNELGWLTSPELHDNDGSNEVMWPRDVALKPLKGSEGPDETLRV